MISRQWSKSTWSQGWKGTIAALLTSTSILPARFTTVACSFLTSAASPTSVATANDLLPQAFATLAAAFSLTSATTTVAPSWPRRRAIAAPIPWAAPVTIATRSVNRFMSPPPVGSSGPVDLGQHRLDAGAGIGFVAEALQRAAERRDGGHRVDRIGDRPHMADADQLA